jgi:hypothetical protein
MVIAIYGQETSKSDPLPRAEKSPASLKNGPKILEESVVPKHVYA